MGGLLASVLIYDSTAAATVGTTRSSLPPFFSLLSSCVSVMGSNCRTTAMGDPVPLPALRPVTGRSRVARLQGLVVISGVRIPDRSLSLLQNMTAPLEDRLKGACLLLGYAARRRRGGWPSLRSLPDGQSRRSFHQTGVELSFGSDPQEGAHPPLRIEPQGWCG